MTKVTRGWGLLEPFLSRARAQKVQNLLGTQGSKRVLDVGCGKGSIFLAECKAPIRVALDRDLSQKDIARFAKIGIKAVVCDVEREKIPFDDKTFDLVVMLAVLEHFDPKNVKKVISEIFRVMASGGVLVLTTPVHWTGNLLQVMALFRLVSPVEIAEHKKNWRIGEIVDLLVKVGFGKEKIESGYFQLGLNTWIVARK